MLLLLSFIASLLVVGYVVTDNLVITHGKSVDGTIFLKNATKNLNRNDYVIIQSSPEDTFSKGALLAKKIACTPGEVLEIIGLDYFCNKDYLGKAKLKSATGIPVVPFNPCGIKVACKYIIPEKFYFVIGDSKDSYDSRYFGLVSEEKIVTKLHKIW